MTPRREDHRLEPDLAQFMAEAMGVKLTLKPIAFPNLVSALELRQVDLVLSGMTITAGAT